jgi:hypothetical protein
LSKVNVLDLQVCPLKVDLATNSKAFFVFIHFYLKNGYFLNIQLSEDAGSVSIQNKDPVFDTVVFTPH